MQCLASHQMNGTMRCSSSAVVGRARLAPIRQPCARRLLRVRASLGPQPLADVALKVPGAGRLASKAAESLSNPKDQKRKQQERQREQEREQEEARQQQEHLEQQQEQLAHEAATAAADSIQAAAGELQEGAAAAAADTAATAVVPEALAAARTRQQVQQELSDYTEEAAQPKTIQERYSNAVSFLTTTGTGKGVSIAGSLFLGATLLIALYRTYQKYSSPRAQRKRVIDKNKLLVEELSKYLPDRRGDLSPGVVRKLRGLTGFSPVEVFRKYLWFLLRERSFDADAVQDMVQLKSTLGLNDHQVAEALKERAQRIYDKYGTLMLNVDGMTAEGVERKATCQGLFAKLLFLTEHEPLVAQGSEAFKSTDLRMIFGATDEDVERLRIVSLYDVDLDRMDAMMGGAGGDASTEEEQQGAGGPADKERS